MVYHCYSFLCTAWTEFSSSIVAHYRVIYYEAIDHLITAITNRFDQPGYRVYSNLAELLLKSIRGSPIEDEVKVICNFMAVMLVSLI